MKTILFLFFAFDLIAASPVGIVTLEWGYPTNEISTNLTFRLYGSTNITIPLTNWTVITNISGIYTQAVVKVTPGLNYFTATASNMWGESDFSNVALTPPLPRNDTKLSIKKVE